MERERGLVEAKRRGSGRRRGGWSLRNAAEATFLGWSDGSAGLNYISVC